jgi:hypothetical protein
VLRGLNFQPGILHRPEGEVLSVGAEGAVGSWCSGPLGRRGCGFGPLDSNASI